jgi:hypothetical protein
MRYPWKYYMLQFHAYVFCFCWCHIDHIITYSAILHLEMIFKVLSVKLIRYQFWCTRCAFRLIKSLQWYSGQERWKSGKKSVKTVKERKKEIMCHEIEPNPSKDRAMHEGDNPSFCFEFIKFTFFLTVLFIFVLLSKYRSS